MFVLDKKLQKNVSKFATFDKLYHAHVNSYDMKISNMILEMIVLISKKILDWLSGDGTTNQVFSLTNNECIRFT